MNQLLLQIAEPDSLSNAAVSGMDALQRISGKFLFRYLINFVSVFVLIRLVYYPIYKRSELFFTYFIFNTIIFLICFLLNKVELSMGAAFGLFAVFSMLRYRTEELSMKDMTYLFMVIAMGLIAAVTKIKDASEYYEYLFIIMVNVILIVLTFVMESRLFMKTEMVKTVYYENIQLVQGDKEAELMEDLRQRTGLNIHRIHVQRIDFLKDAAVIKIYYYPNPGA